MELKKEISDGVYEMGFVLPSKIQEVLARVKEFAPYAFVRGVSGSEVREISRVFGKLPNLKWMGRFIDVV